MIGVSLELISLSSFWGPLQNDGQLALTFPEILSPELSLLPSVAEHSLAQSLQTSLTQLFNSDRYTHLLTGLMMVTGRKAGELLKSKKFYPHPDDAFALLFSSTIATTYDRLVTLIDAATVLDAIARLKAHPDVQPLLYLSPKDIDSRCLPHIARTLSSRMPLKNLEQMSELYHSLTGTQNHTDETVEKLKRPSTVTYNFYTDDRHRFDEIVLSLGFDATGTQPNIFHSLLDWVEKQIKKDVVQHPESMAIAAQAKTLAWLTGEINTLRERVAILEQERDGLKSQLEQARSPDPPIELLKTDNDRLSSELEKANSTLSVFRQLLNGDGDEMRQPPKVKSETPPSTLIIEPTTAIVSPSVEPSPTPVPKTITTSLQPHQKKHRRLRSDGGAKQRAISIWNALQQWNHLHPDYTFALTPALLEVTFHIHRAAAHQLINDYKLQIDEHHNALGVGTVRTHNRGKEIEPFKAFVEQGFSG